MRPRPPVPAVLRCPNPSSGALPLQDVKPGVVVGDVDQPVLCDEDIGGVPHFGAPTQRLGPSGRLWWHEVADFLWPERIGDVEHADTCALPGREDRRRALEGPWPVLVKVV